MSTSAVRKDREYTLEDFFSRAEDERWEIIDGVAYMMATPSENHQRVSTELTRQFANYFVGKTCQVYHAPFAVWFPQENENKINKVVEPDIAIICDSSKIEKRGCAGAPD